MKAIGNVMRELDPGGGPTCFALSITNSVQCISGTYSYTMMNPITFMSHIPTVTASFGDKDGLSYTSAGVPDLPLLVFGILLQYR